jgi:hypothetical protein
MGDGGFGDYRVGSFEVYTTSLNSTQINNNYTESLINYICPTPTPTVTPTNTNTPTVTQTQTPSPNIIQTGLIVNLDAGQSSSYPGSGSTWTNIGSGGATYNATLLNSPTYSSNYGGILTFNGTNQSTSITRPVQDDFTLNVWFRTTSNAGTAVQWYNGIGLMDCEVGTLTNDFGLTIGAGKLMFGVGNPDTTIISPLTYNNGLWYNVTATRVKSTGAMVLYVNGVQVATGTSNTNTLNAATTMYIGLGATSGLFLNGSLGVCQAYTVALTASQVLQNYNFLAPRYVEPTPTPTTTSTPTVTPTRTCTPTITPTNTPTSTTTQTPTNTNTRTLTPTPSTTPSIVTSGLIIQLDAYESSSYSGGTTVFDITSGFNHTLIGATYTVLNGIKCFDCTTGTNRVNLNVTGPTLPTSGYTYITWARLITSTAGFRTLLYTNSPKYTPITIPNASNTLGYWDTSFKSSGYDVASSAEVWVQYAVVGTNTSQTFYINGSQVGSTISAGAGGTTHWGWGNNDTAAQPWGHVANMYFYNRQLNLAEITQQYNYLAPRFAEITPTPTNTSTPTVTPTTTSTPTVTPTNTLTPTPTSTEPFFILIQNGDILTAQDGSGIEYQH